MTVAAYVKPTIRDIRQLMPSANGGWKEYRELRHIRLIVVHYDAQWRPGKYDAVERLKAQARYHIGKVWGYDRKRRPIYGFGLMYHYSITGDGQVLWTQPEELVTWQARNANPYALGIKCDLGDGQEPTLAQLASLKEVLDWLCYHRPDIPAGRKDVWGHSELTQYGNSTKCPGALLPYVQRYRRREWA
jgi:hypothetical protein